VSRPDVDRWTSAVLAAEESDMKDFEKEAVSA
jgi:hypothetical protein